MRIRRKSLQDVQSEVLLPQEDAEIAFCPFGFFFFDELAWRRART